MPQRLWVDIETGERILVELEPDEVAHATRMAAQQALRDAAEEQRRRQRQSDQETVKTAQIDVLRQIVARLLE